MLQQEKTIAFSSSFADILKNLRKEYERFLTLEHSCQKADISKSGYEKKNAIVRAFTAFFWTTYVISAGRERETDRSREPST